MLNPRAALLSNYEVLALLRELDSEHVAQLKTAHRIKKEESDPGGTLQVPTNVQGTLLEVSENLRTLEVEVVFGVSALVLVTQGATRQSNTYRPSTYQQLNNRARGSRSS